MTRKDGLLALLVVVVWGLNFVVIKMGLHNMPPLMLAGLRFLLVAFPALLFVARPKIPLKLLLGYGLTISFGQFAFLFAPSNSVCLRARLRWCFRCRRSLPSFSARLSSANACRASSWRALAPAVFGVLVLIEGSLNGQHVALLGFMLTGGGAELGVRQYL